MVAEIQYHSHTDFIFLKHIPKKNDEQPKGIGAEHYIFDDLMSRQITEIGLVLYSPCIESLFIVTGI